MSLSTEQIAKLRELAKSTNAAVAATAKKKLADSGADKPAEKPKADKEPAPAKKNRTRKKKEPVAAKTGNIKHVQKKVVEDKDVKECKELLVQWRAKNKKTKVWKKKRTAAGKPEKKTIAEVVSTAKHAVADRVHEVVEKGKALKATDTKAVVSQITQIVKAVTSGIADAKARKAFINEVISALKKEL